MTKENNWKVATFLDDGGILIEDYYPKYTNSKVKSSKGFGQHIKKQENK